MVLCLIHFNALLGCDCSFLPCLHPEVCPAVCSPQPAPSHCGAWFELFQPQLLPLLQPCPPPQHPALQEKLQPSRLDGAWGNQVLFLWAPLLQRISSKFCVPLPWRAKNHYSTTTTTKRAKDLISLNGRGWVETKCFLRFLPVQTIPGFWDSAN